MGGGGGPGDGASPRVPLRAAGFFVMGRKRSMQIATVGFRGRWITGSWRLVLAATKTITGFVISSL